MVGGVHYRYPGLWVKAATTLDVLSGGRAWLGIGAAWNEEESHAYDIAFPPLKERFERLEDALRIARMMFTQPESSYDGRHHSVHGALNNPQPLRGDIPIMVGGSGERKTLRLVAQYADACNLFAGTPEEIAHKLDVLRRHCEDVGRDYDEIAKTIAATMTRPLDDTDGWLASMQEYADLGVSQVWVGPDKDDPVGWTEQMADKVVPRLSEI
jgi:alkanesulfonate monooxygenase SsuD/methylene tetrahydromethanopterin reductase-like flavin-dependent oxidoreductase (luciferase family)